MTLFGRDSLLTAWMLLPLDLSLALGTLRTLAEPAGRAGQPADRGGAGQDPARDQVRAGRVAARSAAGASTTAPSDATPLFVMLLGELRRWGLPAPRRDELLPHADRALTWIEQYGDRDGDGFVEYRGAHRPRPGQPGLEGLLRRRSRSPTAPIAEPPIALAEVQGYVYAAYLARAHFARERGDARTARRWTERAARAQAPAFNRGVLAARPGLLRARPRPRQAPDRRARARTSATACGPASWTGTRRPRSRST